MAGRPLNEGAVIGNALEWYDFTVFGFMTVVIAHLFFPGENEYSPILLTTATFGVAFVMRPVGGIVLGCTRIARGARRRCRSSSR